MQQENNYNDEMFTVVDKRVLPLLIDPKKILDNDLNHGDIGFWMYLKSLDRLGELQAYYTANKANNSTFKKRLNRLIKFDYAVIDSDGRLVIG